MLKFSNSIYFIQLISENEILADKIVVKQTRK